MDLQTIEEDRAHICNLHLKRKSLDPKVEKIMIILINKIIQNQDKDLLLHKINWKN
jgi:hypothetical protein